jgi:hypothetical protein
MFFAAASLEQLAAVDLLVRDDLRRQAFAYAAEWRHGMAGNSPLYMPGFFAVAVASWLLVESRLRPLILLLSFTLAALIAAAFAPFGALRVVVDFFELHGVALPGPILSIPAAAAFAGSYTLVTWTTFVLGVRAALVSRSWRPLLPVPLLTAGLIALRPWTVDDFTTTWWRRFSEGDPSAIASAAAIPAVAWWLGRRALRERSARPDFAQARAHG